MVWYGMVWWPSSARARTSYLEELHEVVELAVHVPAHGDGAGHRLGGTTWRTGSPGEDKGQNGGQDPGEHRSDGDLDVALLGEDLLGLLAQHLHLGAG